MGALFSSEDLDNAISEIYQFTPALNNLYTITLSGEGDSGLEKISLNKIATYHATKVILPSEELELTRNSVTKNFALKEDGSSYKWTDTLTITWRENKNWDVRRYHDAWLTLFYDKTKDCYKSAESEEEINARYRTFTITFPEDSNNNTPRAICYDVIPKSVWPLNLEWNSTSTPITYTIVYYVGRWEWAQTNRSKKGMGGAKNLLTLS